MDKTLRSVETPNLSARFVALGLEPPAVVGDPLAVDWLLVVVILLLWAELLVAVLPLEAVVGLELGVPRMPPWAADGTLSPFAFEAADLNASRVFEPLS